MQDLFPDTNYSHYSHQLFLQLQLLTWKLPELTLVFWLLLFRILADIIAFSFLKNIFDLEKIFFFFFFLANGINTSYKKVLAKTLPLLYMAPKTSLVVLVFFIGLVGGRLLLLTWYVSKKDVSRFMLSGVFILFLGWFISLKAFGIDFWLLDSSCKVTFATMAFLMAFSQISNFIHRPK